MVKFTNNIHILIFQHNLHFLTKTNTFFQVLKFGMGSGGQQDNLLDPSAGYTLFTLSSQYKIIVCA